MKEHQIRNCASIGCCGIDCGLCPQHYSKGESRCPGCGGIGFYEKHPSCGILTCCVEKRGFKTCAECGDYPCERLSNWDAVDSFVSHKNSTKNVQELKTMSLEQYTLKMKPRIEILEKLILKYDDGRSKSKYCLAATLLSLGSLNRILDFINHEKEEIKKDSVQKIKKMIDDAANNEKIELKLRKK